MKNKVLIFKYGFLGDTITTIPLIINLNKVYDIDLLTFNLYNNNTFSSKVIYRDLNLFSKIISINKNFFSFIKLIFILRKNKYLILFNLLSHNQINNKLIYYNFYFKILCNIKIINQRIQKDNHPEVLSLLHMYSHNNLTTNFKLLNYEKKLGLIKLNKINYHVIGISPFSKMSSKNVNIISFKELIYKIKKYFYVDFIFLGTVEQYNLYDDLSIKHINVSNITNLLNLVNRIDIYLGVDNGIMHIADLLNKKLFCLFSDRDIINNWHPCISDNIVIYRSKIICGGCMLEICTNNNKCMNDINYNKIYFDIIKYLK